ncbi:MAG: hypothetical protein L3J53_06380 [Proteobacteria bacterium]|nr:hypothetical protein [Pseudomonadota bacterium]
MKLLLLLLILASFAIFATDNIFATMDEKTSVTTGIYKLSAQERIELLKWLVESKDKTRTEIKQEVRQEVMAEVKQEVREEVKQEVVKEITKDERKRFMGFRLRESDRETIHTSIVGEFKGWKGKHTFILANGHIWKQAESGTFYIPKRTDPKVTIKPKSMGSWALSVEGFSRSVKVIRVK